MRGMELAVAVAALYQICMTPVRADLLDKQQQALAAILSAADSICTSKQKTVSDDFVSNELNEVSTTIGHLGIGARVITVGDQDVVKKVVNESSTSDCKQAIAGMLVPMMVPSIASPAPEPAPAATAVLVPRIPGHFPSVNCSHTTEPIEELLCADDDLAVWDGTMGSIYWAKVHGGASGLHDDQIDWIKTRNAACGYSPAGNYSFSQLLLMKPCFLKQTIQRVTQLGSS
jgi:uncharacterized protein YecT (DUF1311 family)